MKKKIKIYIMICMTIFFISPISTHAKTTNNILIYGKDLPYIMVASINENKTIDLYMITSSLNIPKQNDSTSCKSLDSYITSTTFDQLKEILNQYYKIKVNKYVYLHMNQIQKDFHEPYTQKTFQNIHNLTSYFQSIKNKLTLSTLFHIHNYLQTNIKINELYTLFKTYYNTPLHITYHYPNYIPINNSTSYPLDYTFS